MYIPKHLDGRTVDQVKETLQDRPFKPISTLSEAEATTPKRRWLRAICALQRQGYTIEKHDDRSALVYLKEQYLGKLPYLSYQFVRAYTRYGYEGRVVATLVSSFEKD